MNDKKNATSVLEDALESLGRGLDVIWLKGKAPIESKWPELPRKDARQLQAGYRDGYNYGIRTGQPLAKEPDKAFVAIDVDNKSTDPHHALEAQAAVENLLGDLVFTLPRVDSGRGNGSCHYYTAAELDRLPRSQLVQSSPEQVDVYIEGRMQRRSAWQIEILSTGRQCVGAGSIHPDTGSRYEWHTPPAGPIPDLPEQAYEQLEDVTPRAPAPSPVPDTFLAVDVDTLPVSPRIKQLIKTGHDPQEPNRYPSRSEVEGACIMALVGAYVADDIICSVMTDARNGTSEKPLEERNWNRHSAAERIARQVWKAKTKQALACAPPSPEDWPEPQPLPTELPPVAVFDTRLLPDAFLPWIEDISERMQCPPDFPAVGTMVVIASIVGRKIAIRPKRHDDWTIVPNLWGGALGKPGVMKTPALKEPMNMLNVLEQNAKREHEQRRQEWEVHQEVAKVKKKLRSKAIEDAVKDGQSDPAEIGLKMVEAEPPEPKRRRYVTNDPTVEKVGELLNENPNGLLLFRDELTGFFRSLDKDGHENDRAFYLEAWNGDGRYTYDRIGRGTIDIEAACVSLLGGIQPGPLSAYMSAMARGGAGDDGFMQRFQLLVYPDVAKVWRSIDRRPNMEARNRAFEVFNRLGQLDTLAVVAALDYAEDGDVPYLRFSEEAQEEFTQWLVALNLRLRQDEDPPAVLAHLAKYPSLIPSIALLIHLADEGQGPVTLSALQRAIDWGIYLESHARRIYSPMIASDMATACALARKIERGDLGGEFSLRDIYRHNWTRLAKEDLQGAIDVLIEFGWLREMRVPTAGRPRINYLVNPGLLKKKAA